MTRSEQEHWENEILLRSSGELSEERVRALEEALTRDPELAELARFVEGDLAGASKAPRDFAGEAIASVASGGEAEERRGTSPIHSRWWLRVAAVLVLGGVLVLLMRREEVPNPGLSKSVPLQKQRRTVGISERAVKLERELYQAREVFKQGRYGRSKTL